MPKYRECFGFSPEVESSGEVRKYNFYRQFEDPDLQAESIVSGGLSGGKKNFLFQHYFLKIFRK